MTQKIQIEIHLATYSTLERATTDAIGVAVLSICHHPVDGGFGELENFDMHGTRNEHDEVHIVKDYDQWSEILNKDTNNPNRVSFFFPRFEYFCQKLNFLLSTTVVKVVERLAILSFVATFLGWLLGIWDINLASDNSN